MALSTLRMAMRPCLMARCSPMARYSPIIQQRVPMASSATEEMKDFWKKNEKLGRPSSPWTIYHFHMPMATSLTHRITGVVMGVALYGIAIGTLAYPGDFTSLVELIKSLDIPKPVMFTFKSIAAFPLIYHYINGIRHLSWDAGYGFRLSTQYKTGTIILATSISLALLAASAAYLT